MITSIRFFTGDRVLSSAEGKFAGLGTVTKVNPKTIAVRLDSGLDVKFPAYLLTAAPDAPAAPAREEQTYIHAGAIVAIDSGKFAGIYAVIKGGDERINVAKIGGDNGRYVRASVKGVRVLDAASVTARIVGV